MREEGVKMRGCECVTEEGGQDERLRVGEEEAKMGDCEECRRMGQDKSL